MTGFCFQALEVLDQLWYKVCPIYLCHSVRDAAQGEGTSQIGPESCWENEQSWWDEWKLSDCTNYLTWDFSFFLMLVY